MKLIIKGQVYEVNNDDVQVVDDEPKADFSDIVNLLKEERRRNGQ